MHLDADPLTLCQLCKMIIQIIGSFSGFVSSSSSDWKIDRRKYTVGEAKLKASQGSKSRIIEHDRSLKAWKV